MSKAPHYGYHARLYSIWTTMCQSNWARTAITKIYGKYIKKFYLDMWQCGFIGIKRNCHCCREEEESDYWDDNDIEDHTRVWRNSWVFECMLQFGIWYAICSSNKRRKTIKRRWENLSHCEICLWWEEMHNDYEQLVGYCSKSFIVTHATWHNEWCRLLLCEKKGIYGLYAFVERIQLATMMFK